MKASQLIADLQQLVDNYGDRDVKVYDDEYGPWYPAKVDWDANPRTAGDSPVFMIT